MEAAGQPSFWRKCSACKRPIQFLQKYQVCSVSTCTKKRSGFVFCSVPCWASHVPTFRHRDAWAIEQVAPSLGAFLAELKADEAAAPREENAAAAAKIPVAPVSAQSRPLEKKDPMNSSTPVSESEILVVVSKMKAYIKAKADMNTSADVMDVLSDRLRRLCDEAIRHARQDGRKTVMARDFVSSPIDG